MQRYGGVCLSEHARHVLPTCLLNLQSVTWNGARGSVGERVGSTVYARNPFVRNQPVAALLVRGALTHRRQAFAPGPLCLPSLGACADRLVKAEGTYTIVEVRVLASLGC